ncbi:hypothetical protein M378DRAFT_173841, partial [Amanita muscaria Koide BX008]
SSAVEMCGSTTMGSARPRRGLINWVERLGSVYGEDWDRRSDNGDGYVEYVRSGLGSDQGSMTASSSASTSTTPATHSQTNTHNTSTTWDTTPVLIPVTQTVDTT